MPSWTRLIRFIAKETSQVHLGQPIDTGLDVGLAFNEGKEIKVHEIIAAHAYDPTAELTRNVLTVKQLLAPIAREHLGPVRCLGLNYADHADEANLARPAFPILFYKPVTSIIGPEAPICIPLAAQPVKEHLPDYEVEFVAVIGKSCRDVTEKHALDYVLGYTGANDVSFRKHQMAVSQWGFSKSFDNTNPLGPCIVAAETIPDPQNVPLKTILNGETVQDGNTTDQIFSLRKTIAHLSQGTTLLPGTVILTGTPKGVGFVKKPPIYLKHGDEVRVWVGGGIGTLVNRVEENACPKLFKL